MSVPLTGPNELEKVTDKAKLNVVLGDTGLADEVVKLL